MSKTTPLIKGALSLRVGAGFDVYESLRSNDTSSDKILRSLSAQKLALMIPADSDINFYSMDYRFMAQVFAASKKKVGTAEWYYFSIRPADSVSKLIHVL